MFKHLQISLFIVGYTIYHIIISIFWHSIFWLFTSIICTLLDRKLSVVAAVAAAHADDDAAPGRGAFAVHVFPFLEQYADRATEKPKLL